jgi:hypothetical protein
VLGCLIGADSAGVNAVPNGGDGIFISNSSNNVIGRTLAATNANSGGMANMIAFNGGNGVDVASGNGNAIRGNSIYANTLLGIDLGPGANMNQAAPVLSLVQRLPLALQVSGMLASDPNTVFTIEFFANSTSAPSGRVFLVDEAVRTNQAGVATFTYIATLPPAGADFITATATDPLDNTSELSAAAAVTILGGS